MAIDSTSSSTNRAITSVVVAVTVSNTPSPGNLVPINQSDLQASDLGKHTITAICNGVEITCNEADYQEWVTSSTQLNLILEKYDCHITQGINYNYVWQEQIQIALLLMYLRILKNYNYDRKTQGFTVLESTQFFVVNVRAMLQSLQLYALLEDQQLSLSYITDLKHQLRSFLLQLNISQDNIAFFIDDFTRLCRLAKPIQWPQKAKISNDSILKTTQFIKAAFYTSLPFIQEGFLRICEIFQHEILCCLKFPKWQISKKDNDVDHQLKEISRQVHFLQNNSLERLRELGKKLCSRWTFENQLQKKQELIHFISFCNQAFKIRTNEIRILIKKIALTESNNVTDQADMLKQWRYKEFRLHACTAQHAISHFLQDFSTMRAQSGRQRFTCIDKAAHLHNLSATFDVLMQALTANTPECWSQTEDFVRRIKSTPEGELAAEVYVICKTVFQPIMSYLKAHKAMLSPILPSALHELLEIPILSQLMDWIKEAFTKFLDPTSCLSLDEVCSQIETGLEMPREFFIAAVETFLKVDYKKRAADLLKRVHASSDATQFYPEFEELISECVSKGSLFKNSNVCFQTSIQKIHNNCEGTTLFLNNIREALLQLVLHRSVHFEQAEDPKYLDDSWLDEIDSDDKTAKVVLTDIAEEEQKDKKEVSTSAHEVATNTISDGTESSLFTLPAPLPVHPEETLELFRQLSNEYYQLPHPHASPRAIQTLASKETLLTMRQRNFALICVGQVVKLQRLCVSKEHLDLMTSLFFVWEHQAIEQTLTHQYTLKFPQAILPHHLGQLMADLGLQISAFSIKDNPDATRYFRYPFSHTKSSLALQHIIDCTHKPSALSLDAKTWLRDMISLLAAIPSDKSAKRQHDFSSVAKLLEQHVTKEMDNSKEYTLKKINLTAEQKTALQRVLQNLKNCIPNLNAAIEAVAKDSPYSQQKVAILKNIMHHCKCLSVAIDLFKAFPLREFIFLHAITQQLATQYLAENLGIFLSLKLADPIYSHDLTYYCRNHGLDEGLTTVQKQFLESLNLKKASEYVYKHFHSVKDKLPHARMQKLNQLYEQSQIPEGFTANHKKMQTTLALQVDLVETAVKLADLSVAMITHHFSTQLVPTSL